jgi:hypothetical protein
VLEFLSALDRTLELEAGVTSTKSPSPEAIGLGKDLEERTRKLGNPSLGSKGIGWGRAPQSKPGRLSHRCPPPWSHSPPRLNLGWVSLMAPHHFRPNDLSCHTLGRLGAELRPAVRRIDGSRHTGVPAPPSRDGEAALRRPISLVRLRLGPANIGSVIKSGSSILSPTIIIQW